MSGQQAKQTSRWGSLLSGAVAGLESRLDTILADGETQTAEEVARKAKAGVPPKQTSLKLEQTETSRPSSRNRTNDRLHDRLAKAVGKGAEGQRSGTPSSELPSRTTSPALGLAAGPTSTESRRSDSQQDPSIADTVSTEIGELGQRGSQDGGFRGSAAEDRTSEGGSQYCSTYLSAWHGPS